VKTSSPNFVPNYRTNTKPGSIDRDNVIVSDPATPVDLVCFIK